MKPMAAIATQAECSRTMSAMLKPLLLAALVFASLNAGRPALAVPARVIILRHGEKADHWKLCKVGRRRAMALNQDLLGREARRSLFATGEAPAAILAITLHAVELISPTARSWRQPIHFYSAIHKDGNTHYHQVLSQRTREAAGDVLNNPFYNGKTVVMVWEHKHIANALLEQQHPGKEAVTLRQLLQLNTLQGVPRTWPENNYDYFWIVDFHAHSAQPSKFTMVRQIFSSAFAGVPSNTWGAPDGLTAASGCISHEP